jgi:hypothetical protein
MLGLIKGRTMLPMPSKKLIDSDETPNKDKAHIFESNVVKQLFRFYYYLDQINQKRT